MKKIFTLLLTAMAMASTASVKAETVKEVTDIYVDDAYVYCDNMTSEITQDGDTWTISDFLGSGKPLKFSPNSSNRVSISDCDIVEVSGKKYRYLAYDGSRISFTLKKGSDEYVVKQARYILNVENSYMEEYKGKEAQEKGYKYHVYIDLRGFIQTEGAAAPADGDTSVETWIDVDLYWGEPVVLEEVGSQEIEIYSYTYDDATKAYNDYAKPYKANLVKYNDGSYEIKDFLGSGQPVSFSFTEPEAGKEATMSIAQTYVDGTEYCFYDTNYYTAKLEKYSSTDSITLEYLEYDPDYVYVEKYTAADAAEYKAQYGATIYVIGYTNDNWSDWILFQFDFGEVSSEPGDDSAITEITASDNEAPVEYYNLNGIRVENPTNGLYIRKQGSEVKKVVL